MGMAIYSALSGLLGGVLVGLVNVYFMKRRWKEQDAARVASAKPSPPSAHR